MMRDLERHGTRLAYKVIHEVLTHAGEVNESGDAVLLKLVFGAYSRSVKDVGAAVRAAANDDFLVRLGLDHAAVGENCPHSSGAELTVVVLDDGLVDVGVGNYVNIVSSVLLSNEVGACRAETIRVSSGSMSAAVGVVTVGEHIVIERKTLGNHRINEQVRDRRQVVGFGSEVAIVAVAIFRGFEPWLGLEGLGLRESAMASITKGACCTEFYLLHVIKKFFATPTGHIPIVVVLLGAANNKCAIATRGAPKELASAQLHLATINTRALFGDDVPVGFLIEILRPATCEI